MARDSLVPPRRRPSWRTAAAATVLAGTASLPGGAAAGLSDSPTLAVEQGDAPAGTAIRVPVETRSTAASRGAGSHRGSASALAGMLAVEYSGAFTADDVSILVGSVVVELWLEQPGSARVLQTAEAMCRRELTNRLAAARLADPAPDDVVDVGCLSDHLR